MIKEYTSKNMDVTNLSGIITRRKHPSPWSEGDNIPWNEPEFSARMLKEHLSQTNDAASRRFEIIDKHVRWIHYDVLRGSQSRILDLCCGPGFYLQRLTKLKHVCTGIDYSPASINYAKNETEKEGLSICYQHEDIRQADFGMGFNLTTMIFGEFNVFSPLNAKAILQKIWNSLTQGGIFLFEPHSFQGIQGIGQQTPSWYSEEAGLFSDKPHICLEESIWNSKEQTSTKRYFIIDSGTGVITSYAASYQAYTDDEYRSLLTNTGFSNIRKYSSLTGDDNNTMEGLVVFTAEK